MNASKDMNSFLSALADVERLKIAGTVSDEALSLEEIAQRLELSPEEASSHIEHLMRTHLLLSTEQGYVLNRGYLEKLAREQLGQEKKTTYLVDAGLTDEDKKLLAGFMTPEGRLTHLPPQGKKFNAALKYALALIQPGQVYTERELNTELARLNEDTALLRRALVDRGDLEREADGSAYWRSGEQPEVRK